MKEQQAYTVAETAATLAEKHLTHKDSYAWIGPLARAITELADDTVEQDKTEKLLIRLKREGFLSEQEFGAMLYKHLCETVGK